MNLRSIVYQERGESCWRFRIERHEQGRWQWQMGGVRAEYKLAVQSAEKAQREVATWHK